MGLLQFSMSLVFTLHWWILEVCTSTLIHINGQADYTQAHFKTKSKSLPNLLFNNSLPTSVTYLCHMCNIIIDRYHPLLTLCSYFDQLHLPSLDQHFNSHNIIQWFAAWRAYNVYKFSHLNIPSTKSTLILSLHYMYPKRHKLAFKIASTNNND